MNRFLTLFCLAIVIGCSSCKKSNIGNSDEDIVSDMNDLVVPAGFTWESSQDVYFDIAVTDKRFADKLHVISIYDADPSLNGKLLSRGSAGVNSNFLTKIYLPKSITEVFVVKIAPDNTSSMQKVPVSGLKIDLKLAAVGKDFSVPAEAIGQVKGIDDGPNCSTGCTITINNSTSNLNVNSGQVVCITGSNISVNFNANGGTIRVCGTNVTMSGSLNNNSTLILTKGSSVSFGSLNLNGTGTTLTNYGTAIKSGSFSSSGNFTNEYYFATTGDFDMNSGGDFLNNGIVAVNGTMNVNTGNVATNNGAVITNSHFQVNSSSTFINNCQLWAKGNYNNNGITKNYSLIRVNDKSTINSNSELGLYNAAMILTEDIDVNGTIRGYGTTSLVKVTDRTVINSSGSVRGATQFCDTQNGIETNNGTFAEGAVQACGVYIAVTNCNTEGNGTAPPSDTDGDGINDTYDEYPTDPAKAYNNYYPSSSSSGATVAFEDKWPLKGDYDMNDVVVSYRYKIVTNAQNKVVQVNGNYTLHATGGEFQNGFGIEFPVSRTSVSGLAGGTLEAGQTNAVVILFNNMRGEMAQWNTRPEDPVSASKDYTITFNITNGPALSTFGLGSYNPFIWNNAAGRGSEIHLPNKVPTTLANPALFGTGDDNSNPSAARYYMTDNGLPWAISIPINPFKYPAEQKSIVSGYLKFEPWAESGGTQFLDWYNNTTTGYRNPDNLFNP